MSTFISYRVASGDTLFSIARRYNMTVDELKAANNLVSNNLSVGQTLRVKSTAGPGSGTVVVIKPQTGGTGGSTLPPPPPPSGGTAVG
ncbi:MAG TPA: LysM peptidoglycan-binding domain-containing protein, partial [Saprospiraceae bacterium]|nr:LysM peptidoglycan-binding domain-containing protein [Saprospiraceae bacterium]